ncbi:hypothetical protein PMAYCL1PPCAC_31451, partial [Pristionchus mayeri]
NTPILPYPVMQWKDEMTSVNPITAEYSISDDVRARKLIEGTRKPLCLVVVFVNGDGCRQIIEKSQ